MVAFLAYIAVRPAVSGPLFVQGQFLPHPRQAGLCDPKGADLRKYRYNGVLRSHFSDCSTAALVGVEDSTIKMLGRLESAAYQRY